MNVDKEESRITAGLGGRDERSSARVERAVSQNRNVRACLLTQNTKQCNTSTTLRKLFVCSDVNPRVSVVSERVVPEVRRLTRRVRIDIFDYCIYLLSPVPTADCLISAAC